MCWVLGDYNFQMEMMDEVYWFYTQKWEIDVWKEIQASVLSLDSVYSFSS